MMSTATTRTMDPTASSTHLFLAFELGEGHWKLGFSAGFTTRVIKRQVPARDGKAVLREIARAKEHLGLPPTIPVRSCYEAGRDGFWLHRFLVTHGVENLVIDSSSIEVNRRRRRAKTDRLDLEGLVDLLLRYWAGSHKKPFSVVRVPSVEEEDRRHLHRELQSAKRDRTRVTNRMKGLLANHGLTLDLQRKGVPERLRALEQWDGSPLPAGLRARLEREWERVCFYTKLIRTLQSERREMLHSAANPMTEQVLQLLALRGIGVNSAWLFVMEFFGWREFRNRKEVGALAGLAPTPYQSGESGRELGMSKAGNRHVRSMVVEIAWAWLRFQPQSRLSQWYQERYGSGSKRMRKIGIVALARKLLIALWRFLETGVLPEGAELKTEIRNL